MNINHMIQNGFDIIDVCWKSKIYFHCKAGTRFSGCSRVCIFFKTITSK